jgi:proline dehydrogenase
MRIPIVNRFTCSPKQLNFFIKNLKSKNFIPILDYANENFNDFDNNYIQMQQLISNYPKNVIALKLSSLNVKNNFDYSLEKADKLIDKAIINKSKILIDAEDYDIQDDIYKISNILLKKYNKSEVNVYKTYQMYRKDTLPILIKDLNNKDFSLGCKLVRGAYYNQDFKYGILFNKIEETHQNYDQGIKKFIELNKKNDKLLCATHNPNSIELALKLDNTNDRIEYAQLMGMSDNLSNHIINNNKTVYKYLPYGNFMETLPYLIRRLYENYPMIVNIFK